MTAPTPTAVVLERLATAHGIVLTDPRAQVVRTVAASAIDLLAELIAGHVADKRAGLADYLTHDEGPTSDWCAGHASEYFPCGLLRRAESLFSELLAAIPAGSDQAGGRR